MLAVFMWLTCSEPTSSKTTSKSCRIRENPRLYQRQIIQLRVCLDFFPHIHLSAALQFKFICLTFDDFKYCFTS